MKKILLMAICFTSCNIANESREDGANYEVKVCNNIGCEVHTCVDFRIFDNTYKLYSGKDGKTFKEFITISNGYIVYVTPVK